MSWRGNVLLSYLLANNTRQVTVPLITLSHFPLEWLTRWMTNARPRYDAVQFSTANNDMHNSMANQWWVVENLILLFTYSSWSIVVQVIIIKNRSIVNVSSLLGIKRSYASTSLKQGRKHGTNDCEPNPLAITPEGVILIGSSNIHTTRYNGLIRQWIFPASDIYWSEDRSLNGGWLSFSIRIHYKQHRRIWATLLVSAVENLILTPKNSRPASLPRLPFQWQIGIQNQAV